MMGDMIVAIGLIGVFLSGFLLGILFRRQPTDSFTDNDLGYFFAGPNGNPAESAVWVDDETVTGDVPPSWTGDALR